ncbi:hypothetical protein MSG28_014360 [Choristoneura fumiferana]|uniref:Uncharacterized protein n=1 Tax=Choristoneura fumiferana TaxID=7141 RepID=A0ACC0JGY6_CHOFU|nr:hypothetical protein MSG28_014360 [Choristoneura fumiferana]
MTGESSEHSTRTFNFSYPTCTNPQVVFRLSVPVALDARPRARELVQRLIRMFHVPVYLENELNEKLAQFIAEETKKLRDDRDAALLARLRGAGGGEGGAEGGAAAGGAESAVRLWERRFKDHEFAALYHKLVHSPALAGVLRAQAGLAAAARAAAAARDQDIQDLTLRRQINALAARQCEAQDTARARGRSQLDALAHAQRQEHRRALRSAVPNFIAVRLSLRCTHHPATTLLQHDTGLDQKPSVAVPAVAGGGGPRGVWGGGGGATHAEESFTIHLGSQLKQTHNLRIVAADVEDLFEAPHADEDECRGNGSIRVGGVPSAADGAGAVLGRAERGGGAAGGGGGAVGAGGGGPAAARLSTDHHFPALDDQLQHIADLTREPIEKRNQLRHERRVAEAAAGAGAGAGAGAAAGAARARRGAQTGTWSSRVTATCRTRTSCSIS